MPEHMVARLREKPVYQTEAIMVDMRSKSLFTQNGRVIRYKNLVSTIPLNELVRICRTVPVSIKKAAAKLAYNSVLCISVAVKGTITEKCHWIYFPENKYKFARLYFLRNFSKNTVPAGHSVVGAIITYKGSTANIGQIKKQLIKQLRETGIIKKTQEIEFTEHRILPYGFCLSLLGTKPLVDRIRQYLASHDIYSIGRYGEWKYAGMEHALEDGRRIALQLH